MNTKTIERRCVHSDTAQPDNYESSSSSPPPTAEAVQMRTVLAKLVRQAVALREAGKLEDAIRLYRTILKGVKQQPALVAGIQSELGRCHTLLGQFYKARRLLMKAARIVEKELGAKHPDRALYLHNLAAVCHAQGKYAAARRWSERVRDILGFAADGVTGLMPWNLARSFVSASAQWNQEQTEGRTI